LIRKQLIGDRFEGSLLDAIGSMFLKRFLFEIKRIICNNKNPVSFCGLRQEKLYYMVNVDIAKDNLTLLKIV